MEERIKINLKFNDKKLTIKSPNVVIPVGGVTPSGTLEIDQNGVHNVKYYEYANVNVPIPEGYLKPEGTLSIVENGTYSVIPFESVMVDVPIPEGYLKPEGTVDIATTEEVDVTNYAAAKINDENLKAENIAENVTVLGITGTFRGGIDTSDGDVTAGDILAGKVAYAKEERIVGTIETYDYSNSEEVSPEIDKLLEASVTEIYNDRVTILRIGFGKQKSLEKVNFPNVTNTENDTFSGCSSLVEVQMPKCRSIGISAFRSASALEYLSLPSLLAWSSTPFYACAKLKTLRLKSMQELKGAGSFQECRELSDIYLGYDGLVTLSATSVLKSSNTATNQGYINIHIKPEYVDSYTDATNWTDLIASGFVKIIGDYEEVD